MSTCVTCGDELHPERAEKYDHCTKPECRERSAKGLTMVAVGVNKAADQFVVLDERTEREMASGRYKKQPEAPGGGRRLAAARRARGTRPKPHSDPRAPSPAEPRRPWSEAQENLAVVYRGMGMRPDQIAKKLGVSPWFVTQILLDATARGRR
jgi:hypothetical protein